MLYAVFVLGFIILGLLSFSKVDAKLYIVIAVVFLSFWGFIYDPYAQWDAAKIGSGVDLVRYFDMLDKFRFYGDNIDIFLSQPLSRQYFLFLSGFSNNNLLPGFTAILFYLINLVLIYRIGKDNKYNNSVILSGLFIFIILADYFEVINSIRFPLAVTFFNIVFYLDILKNYKLVKIFYVIPLLFHPGTVIFLFVRIVVREKIKYTIMCSLAIIFLLIGGGETLFDKFISISGSALGSDIFLTGLQLKTMSYTTDIVYQVPLLQLSMAIFVTMNLPILTTILAYTDKYWIITHQKLVTVECLLVAMSIFFLITNISTGNISTRITVIVPFFSSILIMPIRRAICKEKERLYLFYFFLSIYILVIFLIRFGKMYTSWVAPGL